VYGLLARWKKDGVLGDTCDLLRARIRIAAGRDPEPSAAIIDSQTVQESAEGVLPAASTGSDSHKRTDGRKRHLLADTLGLLIAVIVTPASTQDRDVAYALAHQARHRGRHRLHLIWADQAYEGPWTWWAFHVLGIAIHVVRRLDGQRGFVVLPRRWVVERTNAWVSRRRRCARDYERLPARHEAMVQWAAILQMTRRLAKTTTTKAAAA
jgi:transposase